MKKHVLKCVLACLWALIICTLLFSCSKINEYSAGRSTGKSPCICTGPHDVVYLQTNHEKQNAILAYKVYSDGQSVLMDGAPFLTGGMGLPYSYNAGSFNSDKEVRLSNDKRFLLTVNSGNNTISVFKVQSDGALSSVPGSPFPSGGETPVSIEQWQQYIIVLNKSNHPAIPSSMPPNYSIFTLQGDGSLVPVPNGKFEVRDGISPGQILASRTGAFVYGSNTWGFDYTPPAIRMNIFSIGRNGVLTPGPAAPPFDPLKPGALGMCQNAKQNVLYVAFPFAPEFSTYEMNTGTGELTHIGDSYARPGCSRFCSNKSGNSLFTANTMENSVSRFDISNPRAPRKTGDLSLKNVGPMYSGYFGEYTTSQCVSLASSTKDDLLYVVSQHTNPDTTIGNYNYLHILQIENGLQEKDEPVQLPVANKYRPRGLAVLRVE
ncbi:hypothetical protein [Niastella populi]|uniref:Uncharacterized protein n=1 Tax=Niastella populi TaxID=550983 RepID=A0A1V9FM53_9BACT|nr:hypothetical protein [Niastella populi]OQP59387.1 hypothetical protein A4R26_21460 [Niastella populi]